MTDDTAEETRDILKGLLARGGAALTLAVISYSNGDSEGRRSPWHVISPEIAAAAEQAFFTVSSGPPPVALERALQSALNPEPATALPSWLTPIFRAPSCLSYIGKHMEHHGLHAALGNRRRASSPREKGLAATALALCRQQDTLLTLAARLPDAEDGRLLSRMGRLAYALAAPGEPSAVRGEIRKLLKGVTSWDA